MEKEILNKLLRAFEQVFAERGVYRTLAQRLPDWKFLFDEMMNDAEYRSQVSETFAGIETKLAERQALDEFLKQMDVRKGSMN